MARGARFLASGQKSIGSCERQKAVREKRKARTTLVGLFEVRGLILAPRRTMLQHMHGGRLACFLDRGTCPILECAFWRLSSALALAFASTIFLGGTACPDPFLGCPFFTLTVPLVSSSMRAGYVIMWRAGPHPVDASLHPGLH